MNTFLAESTNVKHLASRFDVSVVASNHLPFTREPGHGKVVKVQELQQIFIIN